MSRLGLGTAEIGFAYGLGEKRLPSEAEAVSLLQEAVRMGVTFFDTANYYGLAEERLGKSGILKDSRIVVCTKCAQFLEKGEYFSASELDQKIRAQVESSRQNLGLDTLPLLLIHGPSKAQIEEGVLLEIMQNLQAEKLIQFWGASTRGTEAPLALLAREVPVLEVAYNLADSRMESVFTAVQNTGIINRSVFLKGVFAGKVDLLPDSLLPLKLLVTAAAAEATTLGISLKELALRYTLSEPKIHTTLVGTANRAHLEEALVALAKGPLPVEVVARIRANASKDEVQVDPAKWPQTL